MSYRQGTAVKHTSITVEAKKFIIDGKSYASIEELLSSFGYELKKKMGYDFDQIGAPHSSKYNSPDEPLPSSQDKRSSRKAVHSIRIITPKK
jgi:hypothetical protein